MSSTARSKRSVARGHLVEVARRAVRATTGAPRRTPRCCRRPGPGARPGARTTRRAPRCPPRGTARSVSAPDPVPASSTRAPGKTSAVDHDRPQVLRVDDLGAPRASSARSPRTAAGRRRAPCPWTCRRVMPSGCPIRSSCARVPQWVWYVAPACKREQVGAVPLVDQQHLLARLERRVAHRCRLAHAVPRSPYGMVDGQGALGQRSPGWCAVRPTVDDRSRPARSCPAGSNRGSSPGRPASSPCVRRRPRSRRPA